MKSKVVFVAFLLMLYIAPMIFISSYGPSAAPTEQNMTKDFAISSDWYEEDWHYRKNVIMYSGLGGLEAPYTVKVVVPYDTDMQADFDDIRFTDNDNVTLLDYWLETANATSATFWVEVTDSQEWGTYFMIQMYYGNDEVSTTSNGEDTFLFYEDWSGESIDPAKWDIIDGDGSVSWDDTDAKHGSVIKVEGGPGEDVYQLVTDLTSVSPTSVIGRVNIGKTAAASQRTAWGMGSTAGNPMAFIFSNEGSHFLQVTDDDGISDHQNIDNALLDTYQNYMITRDGTDAKLYVDYVLEETGSCEPDTNAVRSVMLYVRDTECDLYVDWVAVRKFVANEPAFNAWGEEESNLPPPPPPEWVDAGTAIIMFEVPIFTGSLDALLIFLGLIMIPASTLYFVKGGKEDMSSDKLFYCLIAFVMGWALFLGGIYG